MYLALYVAPSPPPLTPPASPSTVPSVAAATAGQELMRCVLCRSMGREIGRVVYVLFHEPLKEIYLWNLDCTPLNVAAAAHSIAVVPTDKHALIYIFLRRSSLYSHRTCIGNKMLFFFLLLYTTTCITYYDYLYMYDGKWNLFVLWAEADNPHTLVHIRKRAQPCIYGYWENKTK